MFSNCLSLTSLNLSTFNTHLITTLEYLFYKDDKLKYINIRNFNEDKLNKVSFFFGGVPEDVVVCLNKENNPNIFNELKKKSCYNIDCSDDWNLIQKRINNYYYYQKCKCEFNQCITCQDTESNKILCNA